MERSFRIDETSSLVDSPQRARRACTECHARKVRCDVGTSSSPCSTCVRDARTCQPRSRQKRRIRRPSTHPDGTTVTPALGKSATSTPYENGYMQRATFIGPETLDAQDGQEPGYASVITHGSSVSRQICDLQKAFTLPSKTVQLALFDNFWNYSYVWDPIIERAQVLGVYNERVSPLLLQAIFLGGSRVSAARLPSIDPHEFYLRAKTLFWTNQEPNPLVKIIAVSLLHWWNPHGPELVSTNTSTFWNRIAVSLALQMGLNSAQRKVPDESLRRRIWWSIVARDCLISAAHGRPQSVNLEYCDVPRPSLHDFSPGNTIAPVFIAYVDLAVIIGRFVNHSIRKNSIELQISEIGPRLQQWIQALPPALRMSPATYATDSLNEYSAIDILNFCQLNVTYYAAVAMLYRARTSDGAFPTAAVLAGSVIAGIFEDFLARDQVRHLGPVYTFYLLVASIALLSCYKYEDIWLTAQEDLKIISHAQDEMKKKWPSAIGSIRSFDKMYNTTITTQTREKKLPQQSLDGTQCDLLSGVDAFGGAMWSAICPTLSGIDDRDRDRVVDVQLAGYQESGHNIPNVPLISTEHFGEPAAEFDWNMLPLDQHDEQWQIDDDLFGGYLFWDDSAES